MTRIVKLQHGRTGTKLDTRLCQIPSLFYGLSIVKEHRFARRHRRQLRSLIRSESTICYNTIWPLLSIGFSHTPTTTPRISLSICSFPIFFTFSLFSVNVYVTLCLKKPIWTFANVIGFYFRPIQKPIGNNYKLFGAIGLNREPRDVISSNV